MLQCEQKQNVILTSNVAMGVLESVGLTLKWMKELVESKSNNEEVLDFQSIVKELKDSAESVGYVSTDKLKVLLKDQEQPDK